MNDMMAYPTNDGLYGYFLHFSMIILPANVNPGLINHGLLIRGVFPQ